MGSRRLPGKVMKKIHGIPMLLRVLERVSYLDVCDKIIVSTTLKEKDDEIVSLIKNQKFLNKEIFIFRGDEENVLDRFYKTAQFFKLDTIIRVTADNPLIDYRIIEKLFYKIVRNNILKYDYASTRVYKRTWPFGLDSEVFSFKALKKIWSKELSKSDLEHVTPYFYRNPEEFKVFEMVNNSDLSNIKLSVDTLEDFNFIEKIYKQIYDQNPKFCIDDILNYLKVTSEK